MSALEFLRQLGLIVKVRVETTPQYVCVRRLSPFFFSLHSLLMTASAQRFESTKGLSYHLPPVPCLFYVFQRSGSVTVARRLQGLFFCWTCSWCRIEVRHVLFISRRSSEFGHQRRCRQQQPSTENNVYITYCCMNNTFPFTGLSLCNDDLRVNIISFRGHRKRFAALGVSIVPSFHSSLGSTFSGCACSLILYVRLLFLTTIRQ